ncbi:hypothetical protein RIF29_22658 [Crotalaria pallida]|uniref:Uncharacterized protein n=1 Tax=Crotalaria pallida TaxID=3830 RepID=A0AAN9F4W9_CROPI
MHVKVKLSLSCNSPIIFLLSLHAYFTALALSYCKDFDGSFAFLFFCVIEGQAVVHRCKAYVHFKEEDLTLILLLSMIMIYICMRKELANFSLVQTMVMNIYIRE